MSRNYRLLAAERMALLAEKDLELSELREKLTDQTEINGRHQLLNAELRQEADRLKKDLEREKIVNSNWEKVSEDHLQLQMRLEGVKEAQGSLLKRIYWFLVNYPVEGDLAAVSARQGLLDAIDEINKDDKDE